MCSLPPALWGGQIGNHLVLWLASPVLPRGYLEPRGWALPSGLPGPLPTPPTQQVGSVSVRDPTCSSAMHSGDGGVLPSDHHSRPGDYTGTSSAQGLNRERRAPCPSLPRLHIDATPSGPLSWEAGLGSSEACDSRQLVVSVRRTQLHLLRKATAAHVPRPSPVRATAVPQFLLVIVDLGWDGGQLQAGPRLSGVSCCWQGTAEAWTSVHLAQQEVGPTQHAGSGPAAVQGTAGVLQGRQGG